MEKYFKEDISELAKRYRKMHWGYIAKCYSKSEEKIYYRQAANLLSKKYNHIISEDKVFEILSKRGNIYTMHIINKENAFYEFNTGNILISHFLDRMTQTLLHEMVHKLGFSSQNEDFNKMSVIFNESGVELVSAKALDEKEKIEFLFHNASAKMPNKISDSFITVALTNQINEAVGGEWLEKSILKGENLFEPEIDKRYGEGSFVFIKENIEDLARIEGKYWRNYKYLSEEEKKEQEDILKSKIIKIQDFILESEFDKRFENVNSLEKGKEFLEELKIFGLNRVKFKANSNYTAKWKDSSLDNFFNKYKKEIEEKYGNVHIAYDETFWENNYEFNICDEDEISNEEKRAILNMSIEFQKMHKAKGIFSKLLYKIKGKTKSLPEETNIAEEQCIKLEQYIGDVSQNIENVKRENKTILEEREK